MPASKCLTRLEVFMTNRCNLNCRYCSSKYIVNKGPAKTLSFKEIACAVDLFSRHRICDTGTCKAGRSRLRQPPTVCFTGGEPFLEFELLKKSINYIRGKYEWFDITVNTNGTLLNREKLDFLLDKDAYVAISFDGGKTAHDCNRKFYARDISVYNVVMSNLRKLSKEHFEKIRASVTITSGTVDSMIKNIDFLQEMGFRFVELGLDSYEIWTDAKIKLLKEVLADARKHFFKIILSGVWTHQAEKAFSCSFDNKQSSGQYPEYFTEVSLSPEGCFFPNDMLATSATKNKEYVVGDLKSGIDFKKLKNIYLKASNKIPRGNFMEGIFSPVDRYLYAVVHNRNPVEMVENASKVNRIFTAELGSLLEIQRAYGIIAKDERFGDFEHRPKYISNKEIKVFKLKINCGKGFNYSKLESGKCRQALDFFLYSPGSGKKLIITGADIVGYFDKIEGIILYTLMKSRYLEKRLKITLEGSLDGLTESQTKFLNDHGIYYGYDCL